MSDSQSIIGWWISWYDVPGEVDPESYGFDLEETLTWITGMRCSDDASTVVACLHISQAATGYEAEEYITNSYEDKSLLPLEFRFCDPIYKGDRLPWEHEGGRFTSSNVPEAWKAGSA